MRIGGLDQRVTLYSVTQDRDEAGGLVDTPAQVATVWAAVTPQKGDESFKAAQQQAARTIKLKLRYRADVETSWLVEWNGDRYDIVDVDRAQRRDGELWLMAVLRRDAT
jgi:SPP1 family predicted phage head-tail adaptor